MQGSEFFDSITYKKAYASLEKYDISEEEKEEMVAYFVRLNREYFSGRLDKEVDIDSSKAKKLWEEKAGDSFMYYVADKRALLRSLMNVRLPKPISKEFFEIQDDFLRQEVINKGIVKFNEIKTIEEEFNSKNKFANKISLWQGDITTLEVGAIVNAANSQMLGCFVPCHGCIDNAIHSVSGLQLRDVCNEYMQKKRKKDVNYEEPTGSAMLTKGFNLLCQYVLHTVGPIVDSRLNSSLKQDLKNCYKACLKMALENGIKSLAFCCISTGEFRFPNDEAVKIAIESVNEFMEQNIDDIDRIVFNVFKDMDYDLYKELL